LIVTAAAIGVVLGMLSPVNAAALVCAGLLSTLIFPTAALAVLRPRGRHGTERQAEQQAG
jgi:ABC-type transport system involved in cytochrome bd biosynthesis fused ATPase/permease subunit